MSYGEPFGETGVAVRPVLAPGEVAGLRRAISAHTDRVVDALHVPVVDTFPDLDLDERIAAIAGGEDPSLAALLVRAVATDVQRHPAFEALPRHPRVAAAVRDLTGAEVDGATVRVRAHVPGLNLRVEPWHTDVVFDDGGGCSRVRMTCWIPLGTGAPVAGLEVAPGRRAEPPAAVEEPGGYRVVDVALAGVVPEAPVCGHGEAVFIDRFTPHRTLVGSDGDAGRIRWAAVLWLRFAAG